MRDIFITEARDAEDFAGVFEFDGKTGYFYLYDVGAAEGSAIVKAIRICNGEPDAADEEFTVAWDRQQRHVALFIKDQIWAAFDVEQRLTFGGDYMPGQPSGIPPHIVRAFES